MTKKNLLDGVDRKLLMQMSDFVQCPSDEQKQKMIALEARNRREWDARYASMPDYEDLVTRPGDTLVGGQVAVDSLLALSKHSPKRLLAPLLDELPLLRLNVAHFLESIVIHERIFFVTPQADFDSYLEQAGLETLNDFLKPLPPESVVARLKRLRDPIVDDLLDNFEDIYGKLIDSPSITVRGEMLELFNEVFRSFATRRAVHDIVPIDMHRIRHTSLQYWYPWASRAFDMPSSNFFGVAPLPAYESHANQVLSKTLNAAEEKMQKVNEWLGSDRFEISAPLVLNHIVKKAGNKGDVLSAALEIRNSKEATAFRNHCSAFEQAVQEGNAKILLEMINEIQDKVEQLSRSVSGPQLNIDISFPPSLTINPVEIWQAIRARRKRHLIFMSHLYESALTSRDAWDRFSQVL